MLRLVLLVLIVLFSSTVSVWVCPKSTTEQAGVGSSPSHDDPPNSGEILDAVSDYICGDDNKKSNTVAVVLGVFINNGKEAVTRVLKDVRLGVEVLRPHQVNFDRLSAGLRNPWVGMKRAKLELRAISKLESPQSVEVLPGTGSLVYQKRTTCGYISKGLIVNAAVRAYSTLIDDRQKLTGSCRYETTDWTPRADYDDISSRVIKNQGNVVKVASVQYSTGMVPALSPENLVVEDGRVDDKLDLAQFILGKISSENLDIGVHRNWSSRFQHYMKYGLKESTSSISIPAKKAGKFFQATAICGDIVVQGWIIPVYLPLSAQIPYSGVCESPEFPEFCVMNKWGVGSPETSLRWRSCYDSYREIQTQGIGTQIQVLHGVHGPYAERLGSKFQEAFLEALRELGDFTTTMDVPLTRYNWTPFNITDWTKYREDNSTLTIPEPLNAEVEHTRVFQLVGACELYSLLTQVIVFVQLNKENRCVSTMGISSATCKVMQKWVDYN